MIQNPNMQPVIDEYISSNTLKSLIEQHQAQQPIIKYSNSPPSPAEPTYQTNYPEVNTNIFIEFYFTFVILV
jgi:hypothetical protein